MSHKQCYEKRELLNRENLAQAAEIGRLRARLSAMERIVQEARYEMAAHGEHCDCETCAAFFDLDYPEKVAAVEQGGTEAKPCTHPNDKAVAVEGRGWVCGICGSHLTGD